jgi:hypothetical protein
MEATKHKEVWRDSKGHFVKAPEPVAVVEAPVVKVNNSEKYTAYSMPVVLLGGAFAFYRPVQTLAVVSLMLGIYAYYLHSKTRLKSEPGHAITVNRGSKSTVIYL